MAEFTLASPTPLSGAPARFDGGLREVGAGAWAWLQPNGAWGEANAGLIAGEDEALLVDTLWDERLAREMLDAMQPPLQGRRLKTVVNTHSDGDHWWGNAVVPDDAQIVTSAASRITITTILRGLRGEGPIGVSPVARARLFAQVAGLRRELDRR
jgi:cyclase